MRQRIVGPLTRVDEGVSRVTRALVTHLDNPIWIRRHLDVTNDEFPVVRVPISLAGRSLELDHLRYAVAVEVTDLEAQLRQGLSKWVRKHLIPGRIDKRDQKQLLSVVWIAGHRFDD